MLQGLSLEAMDGLFGVVPLDGENLERSQMGSVRPIRENLEKDVQVAHIEK